MKQEGSCNGWIAKVHPDFHAVIRMTHALPERYLDSVAHVIRNWLAVDFEHHEVNLMNMESVSFESTIFYGPVFYCSNLCGDHRLLVWLEHSLFLSVDRDVKLDGTIGAAEFLGEV